MRLEGLVCPMLTPVTGRDGAIDHDALAALTRALRDGGVDVLLPVGTTGEFPSLSREQQRAVVGTVVDEAGDRPVVAGCCATSLAGVRGRLDDAAAAGADAAAVITPYYFDAPESGVHEFLASVADDAPLPIVLYNIPLFTDHRLAPSTVASLAEHENVVGVKDSSGDLAYFHRLRTETPDGFAVFQGSTAYAIPSLDAGADGFVAGDANVAPELFADLYRAHADGDREHAVELMNEVVYPFVGAVTSVPTVPALKHLAARAGFDVGPPLPPLPELTDDQRRSLDRQYDRLVDAR